MDKKLVRTGVPQGSILGPLLFILYLNDLTEFIQDCSVSLYANDTALYIELMLTLKLELCTVNEWLAANKLTLNVNKTNHVIFGKPRQLADTPYFMLSIDIKPLSRVTNTKYLGVTLDEGINFNKHIEIVHAKSVNRLGLLTRAREFLDQ